MRFPDVIALILVLIAIATPLLLLKVSSDDVFGQTVVVRAYVVEAGGFKPNLIVVNQGEKVRIVIESMDVIHGIAIPALGINTGPVDVGEKRVIEFVAEKKGVYVFFCSVRCSPFHFLMRGIIVVK